MTRGRWYAVVGTFVALGLIAASAMLVRHQTTAAAWVGPAASVPAVPSTGSPPVPTPSPSRSVAPMPKPSPKPPPSRSPKPSAKPPPVTTGGHLAVAVLDRTTGKQTVANGSERFHTASIVKVDILATLLWQDQTAGRTMTSAQKQTATKMITISDNAAADSLWAAIGKGTGLAAGNRAFGLTHTTPGTTSAHPWGQTLTTAPDQLRLLEVLTSSGGPLTTTSQKYILGLMAKVTSSQRWGVPAAAPNGATVYVKDGWLGEQSDDWKWIVNSIGRIVEPGHDLLVVTLSDHHGTESAGITAVEAAAKSAVKSLLG